MHAHSEELVAHEERRELDRVAELLLFIPKEKAVSSLRWRVV